MHLIGLNTTSGYPYVVPLLYYYLPVYLDSCFPLFSTLHYLLSNYNIILVFQPELPKLYPASFFAFFQLKQVYRPLHGFPDYLKITHHPDFPRISKLIITSHYFTYRHFNYQNGNLDCLLNINRSSAGFTKTALINY